LEYGRAGMNQYGGSYKFEFYENDTNVREEVLLEENDVVKEDNNERKTDSPGEVEKISQPEDIIEQSEEIDDEQTTQQKEIELETENSEEKIADTIKRSSGLDKKKRRREEETMNEERKKRERIQVIERILSLLQERNDTKNVNKELESILGLKLINGPITTQDI
jgi:hypothetical protein